MVWGFFFQAEDGIRVLVRSRGIGDEYKGQVISFIRLALLQVSIAGGRGILMRTVISKLRRVRPGRWFIVVTNFQRGIETPPSFANQLPTSCVWFTSKEKTAF